MLGRLGRAVALGISGWMILGCTTHYTRHMSDTYKDAKIVKKSFAILPVLDIEYKPPGSCFGPGDGNGKKYEQPWLKAVERNLRNSFKDQTFKVYEPDELEQLRIDAPSLYSSAAGEIAATGLQSMATNLDGPPKLAYHAPLPAGGVRPYLQPLHDSDKVDFVILLVQPKMTGETHHNAGHYQAAPGGGGSFVGGGTTTSYTSDIRFGVWSAETGEMVYASGAVSASSGFCLFVSPQQASIDGTATEISTQLKALIARLLGQGSEALELGMSAPGPR